MYIYISIYVYIVVYSVRSCDVFFQAPLILIPQDSHSLSGLMVDLGEISIRNKFVLGEDRNELGYPSIFDEMTLELYNVKVSR